MTETTISHACKVIAYYMGYRDAFNPCDGGFNECHAVNKYMSLDEMVPVLEKLGLNVNLSYQPSTKTYRCRVFEYGRTYYLEGGKPPKKYTTPSEATVLAAAETIERKLNEQ